MSLYVKTGGYVGNNGAFSVVGLGFQPKLVMVTGPSSGSQYIFDGMPATNSKIWDGISVFNTNILTAITADGFNIGTNSSGTERLNENNKNYSYVAIGGDSTSIKAGTYVGNGVDNTDILGIGFQPDFVWVTTSSTLGSFVKTSAIPGSDSFRFIANPDSANGVQALLSDGFQVGDDAGVNSNGVTYYYVAIKLETGVFNVGTYTGNASNPRNITGVGFQPDAALIGIDASSAGVWKGPGMGSANAARTQRGTAYITDGITAFISDGFTVGATCNANTVPHYWMAFKDSFPIRRVTYVGGGNRATTGPLTFSVTVPSVADPFLGVFVWANNSVSITANGVAMTLMGTATAPLFPEKPMLFGLVNPAPGTYNIVVTYGASRAVAGAFVVSDVKQSITPDAIKVNGATGGTALTFSETITTIADNSMVIGAAFTFNASAPNIQAGANTAKLGITQGVNVGAEYAVTLFDGVAPVTPAGSEVLSYATSTASVYWVGITVSLEPAPNIFPIDVTKSARYCVSIEQGVTKSLAYSVSADYSVQKQTQYCIVGESSITKPMVYGVSSPSEVQQTIDYAVQSPTDQTVFLDYRVAAVGDNLQLDLAYSIVPEVQVTLPLVYRVRRRYPYSKKMSPYTARQM